MCGACRIWLLETKLNLFHPHMLVPRSLFDCSSYFCVCLFVCFVCFFFLYITSLIVFYFPEAGGNFVFLGKNLVLNYCDVVQTSSVESFTSKLL